MSACWRRATTSPASHPGARPPAGGWMRGGARDRSLRATRRRPSSSSTCRRWCSSSRPQTSVGTCGTSSSRPLGTVGIVRRVDAGCRRPRRRRECARRASGGSRSGTSAAARHGASRRAPRRRHRGRARGRSRRPAPVDHVPRRPEPDLEGRVIQRAGRTPRKPRRDGLEGQSAEPHAAAAGAERQPVQVDRRRLGIGRGAERAADARRRHAATIPRATSRAAFDFGPSTSPC